MGSAGSPPVPARSFLKEAETEPGRLRIALQTAASGAVIDPECILAAKDAARLCENLGHIVEPDGPSIDPDEVRHAVLTIGSVSLATDLLKHQRETGIAVSAANIGPLAFTTFERGRMTTAVQYAEAVLAMQKVSAEMAAFFQRYDVLLSPTLGQLPPPLGFMDGMTKNDKDKSQVVRNLMPFTHPMNLGGLPSMSVPLSFSRNGLPIGIMFSAKYGADALLLRLAGQLERARPWANRRPHLGQPDAALHARERRTHRL